MTKVNSDVLLLVAGVICLLLAWIVSKFLNLSTLDRDKWLIIGIGMILMGIIGILFG